MKNYTDNFLIGPGGCTGQSWRGSLGRSGPIEPLAPVEEHHPLGGLAELERASQSGTLHAIEGVLSRIESLWNGVDGSLA